MAFQRLFTPIRIRELELSNRIVMSAMGTKLGENKQVTQKMIDYHVARTRGGVALNMIEVSSVHGPSTPDLELDVSSDACIPGYKRLCDAVHEAGGKIGVQLYQSSVSAAIDPEAELIIADFMSNDEVLEMIELFGQSARRMVQAGVDVIELHCAHNYLPHVFLSAAFNHRTDEWGGDLEHRMRFPLGCIDAIRSNMPAGMPLFMRVDCHDDFVENGLTVDDIIAFGKEAKKHGVDLLDVSRGNISGAATIYEVPPVDLPNGFNVEDAAMIRKGIPGMLVMPCGRINTPGLAEQILEEDKADMVVMARANLADPEFCNKAKAGQLNSIKYCVGCNQGCYDYYVDADQPHITCLRNPFVGEEATMKLEKSTTAKRVMIIGGGIGGIETADALIKRGHIPYIVEKSDHLGGQMLLAGVAPRKQDTAMAVLMSEKNIRDQGVEIRLNTEATPKMIKEEKPDAVIIAVGAISNEYCAEDSSTDYILDAHKVLEGVDIPSGNIVVIGGGMVGIEVAEFLHEKGNCITVVEMQRDFATDMGSLRKLATSLELNKTNIKMRLNTKCLKISAHKVFLDTKGEQSVIEADAVVIATGAKSRDSEQLQQVCKEMGISCYVIGDAKEPRRILNAIHEGVFAAMQI